MPARPCVSIVLASYNHADFLRAAIESVQKQTFEDWELIIADDALGYKKVNRPRLKVPGDYADLE